MEYRRHLLRYCPSVPIVGAVYPPGEDKVMIANIASYAFFIGMAVVFGGEYIFKALGMVEPPAYLWVKENKLQTCMFLWIANSMAAGSLSTGAFEVSYDGRNVFSKLDTGELPTMEQLVNGLAAKGAACSASASNAGGRF